MFRTLNLPHRAAPPPARRPAWSALWRDIVGAWRGAIARRESAAIDDATLRDLGIARSELSSFRAETDGLAAPTRLRVVRQLHGPLP
jgi:uncharacterized protein YjiS (DUF1127 family)